MKAFIALISGLCFAVWGIAQPELRAWGTGEQEAGLRIIWHNGAYYALAQIRSEIGGDNTLLVKWSEDGALLWAQAIGTEGRDLAQSLCAHGDGVLVLGRMVEPGNTYLIDDVFLHYFQPDGSTGWRRYFGRTTGGDDEHAAAVLPTASGQIVAIMHEAVGEDRPAYLALLDGTGAPAWGVQLRHVDFDWVFPSHGLERNGTIWVAGSASAVNGRGLPFLAALSATGALQSWETINVPGETCSVQYIAERAGGFLLMGTIGGAATDLMLAWANEEGEITAVRRYRDPTGAKLLAAAGGYELANGQWVVAANRIEETGAGVRSDALWLLVAPDGTPVQARKIGQGRQVITQILKAPSGKLVGIGSTSSLGNPAGDLLFAESPEAWWMAPEDCQSPAWPLEAVAVDWTRRAGGASVTPWLAETAHQMAQVPYPIEEKGALCCPERDTVFASVCAGQDYDGFARAGQYRYFIDSVGRCGLDRLLVLDVRDTAEVYGVEIRPSDCNRPSGAIAIDAEGDSLLFHLAGQAGQPLSVFDGLAPGEYLPWVENPDGCPSRLGTLAVLADCPVYLPSAFSPNGDGRNDVLRLYAPTATTAEVLSFRIFDRYGGLLYETSGPLSAVAWDGTADSKLVNPGVYTCVGKVRLPLRDIEIAQSVSLVR